MNNKPSYNILRKASTPYKLVLDQHTQLPRSADLIAVEEPEAEPYSYFSYKTIDFKGRTVIIRSGWRDHYKQEIILIKDYVLVSCNCGSEVIHLCPHVTKLFTRMIEKKDHGYFDYFKAYPYTDTVFFDEYLTLKSHYEHDVKAVPKPEYGHIFNFENAINPERFAPYHSFFLSPAKIAEEDSNILAYAIASHDDSNIPFLIPCRGILNTEGNAVKSFISFYDPELAPERLDSAGKLLHAHSVDFNQLINFETAHKQYRHATREEKAEMRQIAFNEWKRIIPTLKEQKYLFYHRFYNKLSYKGSLPKNTMRQIALSDDRVSFRFELSEHEEHYRLCCYADINGQDFEVNQVLPEKEPFFFSLKHESEVFYQFFSLEEGRAIGEFTKAGGIFTILKQNFENFNHAILSKLALNYPITYHLAKKLEPLSLKAKEKQIRVEDKGNYVAFTPTIVYSEGFDIPVQSGGTEILQFKNGLVQMVKRDKTDELDFKTFFMELHPVFKHQEALPYFYLSKETLRTELWFARTIYNLTDPNVTFIGLENLTGIDFHMELPEISVNVQEEKGWFDIGVSVTFGEVELSPE
jgi:hypothetical protein